MYAENIFTYNKTDCFLYNCRVRFASKWRSGKDDESLNPQSTLCLNPMDNEQLLSYE